MVVFYSRIKKWLNICHLYDIFVQRPMRLILLRKLTILNFYGMDHFHESFLEALVGTLLIS
jgi:hypothetical protein